MLGERILVIGDSHTGFWSGRNGFPDAPSIFAGVELVHVGAATAYNLLNENSSIKAAPFVRAVLSANQGRYGCIIFCFGEIDCRVHIIRSAVLMSTSIEAAVKAAVDNYISFVTEISNEFGIPILLWGPVPSTPPDKFSFNPGFPAVGSMWERNYATEIFNKELCRQAAEISNVEVFSIFDRLIGLDLVTKGEFLYDGVHLSNSAMEMAEPELRAGLHRLGILEEMSGAIERRWPISASPALRNVAVGRSYTASSVGEKSPEPFGAEPDGSVKFHTDIEDQPFIVIELDAAYLIDTIVIHNRSDAWQERARTLAVALSIDNNHFVEVYAPESPEIPGRGESALRIQLRWRDPSRFVKLYLREREYFHLECVEILVPSFRTGLP